LGCNISYSYDKDLEQKLSRFQHMCGTTQRKLKNETRKDTWITFYKVIADSLCMEVKTGLWINLKGGKLKQQKCVFLGVSGYTLIDHVHNMAIHIASQIYVLEERIQDYKNKWHHHILRMDSSRLRITSQTDEWEDDGRIVFEM
jgi:hypothetical protein